MSKLWIGRHSCDCTYYGAEKPSKKTLVFAQNLENKRSEIFRPARSMVLKVVRGKILETLELAGSPNGVQFRFGAAAGGVAIRLSKNEIISQITSAFQYYRE